MPTKRIDRRPRSVVSHAHMQRHAGVADEHVEAPAARVQARDHRRPADARHTPLAWVPRARSAARRASALHGGWDKAGAPSRPRAPQGNEPGAASSTCRIHHRRGHEAHLRRELPACLRRRANSSAKRRDRRTADRLADRQPVLRAAEAAARRRRRAMSDLGGCDSRATRRHWRSARHPSWHFHPRACAAVAERPAARRGDRRGAELGRLRERELRAAATSARRAVTATASDRGSRRELRVRRVDGQQLRAAAEELGRAAFVDADVRHRVADDGVGIAADRGQRERIGRRAVEHRRPRRTSVSNTPRGSRRRGAASSRRRRSRARAQRSPQLERGQRFRADARVVVAGELAARAQSFARPAAAAPTQPRTGLERRRQSRRICRRPPAPCPAARRPCRRPAARRD